MSAKAVLAIFAAAIMAMSSGAGLASVEVPRYAVENAPDPDSQVKCRKVQVTGSLIRKGKVCRTVAEWKRLQQLGNDAARAIAGEHVCSGGECRGFEPPPPSGL